MRAKRSCVLVLMLLAPPAWCASGEEVYKAGCGLCHDGGATQAPRIGRPGDWAERFPRGRDALLRSATRGVPNTAMLPKGGFPDLADADFAAAVDYLLIRSGFKDEAVTSRSSETNKPVVKGSAARVNDAELIARSAEALREAIAPRARIDTSDGTRIDGIKIESRAGVVTLSGVVGDAKAAHRAEEVVSALPGVIRVDNKLVSAAIFEHD